MLTYLWTDDLNSKVYKDCLNLRIEVFVKEKNSSIEVEIQDEEKCDFIGLYNDNDLIGTGRIFFESKNEVLFQRIAMKKEFRSQGYGSLMIRKMEDRCKSLHINKIKICASMLALNFYKRLGYTTVGNPFDRCGINHIMMEKNI